MKQIKYELGDLVYVVSPSDKCIYDFKIPYGSIVSIHHEMDRDRIDNHQIITEGDDYDYDILDYEVLTSNKEVLKVSSSNVFTSIQDALDYIRDIMYEQKSLFEIIFDLKIASDTE